MTILEVPSMDLKTLEEVLGLIPNEPSFVNVTFCGEVDYSRIHSATEELVKSMLPNAKPNDLPHRLDIDLREVTKRDILTMYQTDLEVRELCGQLSKEEVAKFVKARPSFGRAVWEFGLTACRLPTITVTPLGVELESPEHLPDYVIGLKNYAEAKGIDIRVNGRRLEPPRTASYGRRGMIAIT